MSEINPELLAPCGLYCGVCGVYIATRDGNEKFKERLTQVYNLPAEKIHCLGCLSEEPFVYCRVCAIKSCAREHGYEGCHRCDRWPCEHVERFPLPVGKKVMMRAIPQWREWGTEKWVREEEKRYHCPDCGYPLFRGVKRCRNCKIPLDVD